MQYLQYKIDNLQDDLSAAFDVAPSFCETLLEYLNRLNLQKISNLLLCDLQFFAYAASLIFRYTILLPVRFSLIATSFLYAFCAVFLSYFIQLTLKQRIDISVTYCRLYGAGIGLIAKYHNSQNRPRSPGFSLSFLGYRNINLLD